MSKSDKAIIVCVYYLFIITVPALVTTIGIEYKFLNSSWYVMTITAVLIVLPNVFFIKRANSIKPDENVPESENIIDRHPDLTLLGFLLLLLAIPFSVGTANACFIEDQYERYTMSRSEYSVYLLNKYSPDVLSQLEKFNTKQLMCVNNSINTIPIPNQRSRKISEGIEIYCNAKLDIISKGEIERIENSIYDENLKKSLINLQKGNETASNNIRSFADLIQVAREIN